MRTMLLGFPQQKSSQIKRARVDCPPPRVAADPAPTPGPSAGGREWRQPARRSQPRHHPLTCACSMDVVGATFHARTCPLRHRPSHRGGLRALCRFAFTCSCTTCATDLPLSTQTSNRTRWLYRTACDRCTHAFPALARGLESTTYGSRFCLGSCRTWIAASSSTSTWCS